MYFSPQAYGGVAGQAQMPYVPGGPQHLFVVPNSPQFAGRPCFITFSSGTSQLQERWGWSSG